MFLERPMRRGRPARPLLPATRGTPSERARLAARGAVSSGPGCWARCSGAGLRELAVKRQHRPWRRDGGRGLGLRSPCRPEGDGGGSGGTRPVKSRRRRPRNGRGLNGSPSSWCKRQTGRAVRCFLMPSVGAFRD